MALPYKKNLSKKAQVKFMFNHIAPKYDFLNRLLSLGNDKYWRKKTIKHIDYLLNGIPPTVMLDLATGTGELAVELLKLNPKAKVYGIDIAEDMMQIAKEKYKNNKNLIFKVGDGENLEFDSNTFDVATIGFGIRNYNDIEKGLKETYRVLKPGGILAILELSIPKNPVYRFFYKLHSSIFIPTVGLIFAKDYKAYSYLHNSIKDFVKNVNLEKKLYDSGFSSVNTKTFTFGTVKLYLAVK
jgi:demethylmenaquinone methyltransferase/2-methoxy-6-polyprenyl-1,4-benzoquinol methylase